MDVEETPHGPGPPEPPEAMQVDRPRAQVGSEAVQQGPRQIPPEDLQDIPGGELGVGAFGEDLCNARQEITCRDHLTLQAQTQMLPKSTSARRRTSKRLVGRIAGRVVKSKLRVVATVARKYFNTPNTQRAAWEEESLMCASIRSPYCVAFYGSWWNISQAYIVMELMQYSLWKLLHKREDVEQRERALLTPLHVYDKIRVLLNVAAGLAEVHACGVAHRDLKSGNVLVNLAPKRYGGEMRRTPSVIKLGDFGSSVFSGVQERSERAFGTPHYMPPEVYTAGNGALNRFAIDMFSFGMLCWEVLTGEIPYSQRNEDGSPRFPNDVALIGFILGPVHDGRLIHQLPDWTPAPLRNLVLQCWRVEPDERPTAVQAAAVLTALERELRPPPSPESSQDVRGMGLRTSSTASVGSQAGAENTLATARSTPFSVVDVQPNCCMVKERREWRVLVDGCPAAAEERAPLAFFLQPKTGGMRPGAAGSDRMQLRLLRSSLEPSGRLVAAVEAPSPARFGQYVLSAELDAARTARCPKPLHACALSFDPAIPRYVHTPTLEVRVKLRPAAFGAGKAARVYLSDGQSCWLAVTRLADSEEDEECVQLQLWPEPPRAGDVLPRRRQFWIAAELIPEPEEESAPADGPRLQIGSYREATPLGAPGEGSGALGPPVEGPAAGTSAGRLFAVQLRSREAFETRLSLPALHVPAGQPDAAVVKRARLGAAGPALGVHTEIWSFEAVGAGAAPPARRPPRPAADGPAGAGLEATPRPFSDVVAEALEMEAPSP